MVLFGGFDSYAEELFKVALTMNEAGYDIILFEGPGQGSALEDYHIPMTHEWEKPVKTILDYFQLDDVTLFGMSLGGYLVIRAAAFETRVKRVIAHNICADFYEVLLKQFPEDIKKSIDNLVSNNNEENAIVANGLFKDTAANSLLLKWMLTQGMHITGSKDPYEFFTKMKLYNTSGISSKLNQDVLLTAGQEDHYIPLNQFFEQSKSLVNIRTLTTRLFTHKEMAQNHCQLGNLGISLEVILNWIEQITE
ncbi:alpha/beta hydrolase [Bacillus cereus]|uniref:Alpha/beta hydrolase n=1 Tax=Bacillus cereus TaxID=1396 RepID=A0A9X7CGP4_BACCE|nr:alpha/beta hydrolase [Bacillus cereus]